MLSFIITAVKFISAGSVLYSIFVRNMYFTVFFLLIGTRVLSLLHLVIGLNSMFVL